MYKILSINDIMNELENETLFNKLKRLDKLNNNRELTNAKLIALYNHINKYDLIKINGKSIATNQLQVGARNNNTREKTTITNVIDYDVLGNLCWYTKKWIRKDKVFMYHKASKIIKLDCLLFEV